MKKGKKTTNKTKTKTIYEIMADEYRTRIKKGQGIKDQGIPKPNPNIIKQSRKIVFKNYGKRDLGFSIVI